MMAAGLALIALGAVTHWARPTAIAARDALMCGGVVLCIAGLL